MTDPTGMFGSPRSQWSSDTESSSDMLKPPNTPSLPPPDISPTNAAAIQDWEDKNLEAQIQIYMTLEHEVASLVSEKKTALDVWLALHLKFEGKGLTTCHGTPHLHAPNHLRPSPTPSAYTPVSL